MSTVETAVPVLEARNLIKRYGHVTALDGADFDLRANEILALIGDNGAGKSTLIKALSGAVIPDEGEIFLGGAPMHFRAPLDARRQLPRSTSQRISSWAGSCAALASSDWCSGWRTASG
jgi:fructose transport system ATP-binding protein